MPPLGLTPPHPPPHPPPTHHPSHAPSDAGAEMPIPSRPKKMDAAAAAEAVQQRRTSGVAASTISLVHIYMFIYIYTFHRIHLRSLGVTVLFKTATVASRAGLLAAAVSELVTAKVCHDSASDDIPLLLHVVLVALLVVMAGHMNWQYST